MGNIKISNQHDYSNLFNVIRDESAEYEIDVTNIDFFLPKHILMLVKFFVVQNFLGKDSTLTANDKNGWYLEVIKLADFCNTNFKESRSLDRTILTAIPIKRIDTNNLNQYIREALSFFAKYCDGKDTSVLDICISELINNVSDHSESEYGSYIFSQYYSKGNKIMFAVSDLGIGISDSVNRYLANNGLETLSNIDAVKWSLVKGQSAKSRKHNAGLGMYNILNYLRDIGTIEIFSDDVLTTIYFNGKYTFTKNYIKNFIGTLIEITIYIDKMENLDETILDEFVF